MKKKTMVSLACAAATFATMGVAHSQLGVQAMRRSGVVQVEGKPGLAVTVRSESAARKLIDSLKSSGATYDLVLRDANGKAARFKGGHAPATASLLLTDLTRRWPGFPPINDRRTCVNWIYGDFRIDEIRQILAGAQSRIVQVQEVRAGG